MEFPQIFPIRASLFFPRSLDSQLPSSADRHFSLHFIILIGSCRSGVNGEKMLPSACHLNIFIFHSLRGGAQNNFPRNPHLRTFTSLSFFLPGGVAPQVFRTRETLSRETSSALKPFVPPPPRPIANLASLYRAKETYEKKTACDTGVAALSVYSENVVARVRYKIRRGGVGRSDDEGGRRGGRVARGKLWGESWREIRRAGG